MACRRGPGWIMTKLERQRSLRHAAIAGKPTRKPIIADRIDLWLSTGGEIDGLWVGTTEDKPRPGLRRVEEALQLIKQHSPLHYSRVIHNLERVWIRLVPAANACYLGPLIACELDVRFVLRETTTLEEIASAIVHEATHARLERWGISYDEGERSRIEVVCLRRELDLLAKLPDSEPLREQVAATLEWCVSNHEFFSNANLWQRHQQGSVEALRHLGAPEWLIGFALKVGATVTLARRLVRRLAAPSPQT
jgi:hypothetical protein